MSIEIITKIGPLEFDGDQREGLPNEADELHVRSHWNRNELVVLDWRGHSITVVADDLKRAISNATNH